MEANEADLIVFGTDEIAEVTSSDNYRRHPRKCVAVTETDIPTFFLPGLYAANQTSLLTARRTRTVSYFISAIDRGNAEVRALIGKSVPKQYLYSFMGGVNSWPRRRLLMHLRSGEDTLVEATSHYNHWISDADAEAAKGEQRRRYALTMASSKFSICPRGCGLSSYRLFESMSLGVAPVILADGWEPPTGIDWRFAIFVREADIKRLDAIIRSHESEWQERGQSAQQIYNEHFADPVIAQRLHKDLIELADNLNPAREAIAVPAARVRAAGREVYWAGFRAAKIAALLFLHATKIPVPVPMHSTPSEQLARLRPKPSRL